MSAAKDAVLTDNQSARLDRILEATKSLLREHGVDRMTMREVAAASRVAEGTLYNRFGGKRRLVTTAVLDYFERSVQPLMEYHPAKSPIQKMVYSIHAGAKAILDAPSFAVALMRTYYRVDDRLEMPDPLTEPLHRIWLPVIEEMQRRRQLRSWVSVPFLCGEFSERTFGVTLRWAQGHFPDEELSDRMTLSILMFLLGASRGAQAKEIEAVLSRVSTVVA